MLVGAHRKGHELAELYIGAENVHRHFPRDIVAVELQLGHLTIDCELAPDFWQDHPVIHDRRLSDWLMSTLFHQSQFREPIPLAMVSSGNHSFRLQAISETAAVANGTDDRTHKLRYRRISSAFLTENEDAHLFVAADEPRARTLAQPAASR